MSSFTVPQEDEVDKIQILRLNISRLKIKEPLTTTSTQDKDSDGNEEGLEVGSVLSFKVHIVDEFMTPISPPVAPPIAPSTNRLPQNTAHKNSGNNDNNDINNDIIDNNGTDYQQLPSKHIKIDILLVPTTPSPSSPSSPPSCLLSSGREVPYGSVGKTFNVSASKLSSCLLLASPKTSKLFQPQRPGP
jgi:hypothetical protein